MTGAEGGGLMDRVRAGHMEMEEQKAQAFSPLQTLKVGAPPLCTYPRATALLLCMLPQGHRQTGKVHGSPRT